MGWRHILAGAIALCTAGCPLAVDDPYEIAKPDAAATGGGGGKGPSCSDGTRNGDESDTDCGGRDCPRCANGRTCKGNEDCQSDSCSSGVCEP